MSYRAAPGTTLSPPSTEAPIPDLIATLGAQNKAQREQIAALKLAITALQQEFKAVEQVHEAAKVSKNAELLDFIKAHAREQQTKQTVAQVRQTN